MMDSERPQWWRRNAELRARMGLPEYEPSRLADGTYIHEIVAEIEAEHGVEVELVSEDPSYPSVWVFRLDGTDCVTAKRHRDERGNNVYQITAEELREQVAATVSGE